MKIHKLAFLALLLSKNSLLTTTLVSGGAVSLDGIHPTARGYALAANLFMKLGREVESGSRLIMVAVDEYITREKYQDAVIVFSQMLKIWGYEWLFREDL